MLIIKFLSGLAFIGSVAWFVDDCGYEPAIAIFTSLSAFITTLLIEKKQKNKISQNQSITNYGIGIQAGGDVNLGSIRTSGKTQDAE